MARKPESFPQANPKMVFAKLVKFAQKFGSPEEYMVTLLQALDKRDCGFSSYEDVAKGFKE